VRRPRVLVYGGILLAIAAAAGASLLTRSALRMDVIRDRASLARDVDDGRIENVYRLQIMNTAEQPRRYVLSVRGPKTLEELELLVEPSGLEIEPTTTRMVPVRVRARPQGVHGSQPIEFILEAGSVQLDEKSRFLVP